MTDVTIQQPKRPRSSTEPPTRKRVVDGISSTAYNAVQCPLLQIRLADKLMPYCSSLAVTEQPQFVQLWDCNSNRPTVESKFGPVPKGSLLSYQMPVRAANSDSVIVVDSSLSPPWFALPDLSSFVTCLLYTSDAADE